jgi:hypothetical protein
MTEFFVIMLKRQDGKVYADLHKTTEKIYLTYEDAEKELNEGGLYEGYYCKDSYHIVKLIACLPETLDELAQELPKIPQDAL